MNSKLFLGAGLAKIWGLNILDGSLPLAPITAKYLPIFRRDCILTCSSTIDLIILLIEGLSSSSIILNNIGTVLQNITLRDERISREQVIEASKMIGAHPFIEKLPGGYDYEVMERGATLSMGQRQLISFVRALVFNPRILILDEATSSIDPETESVIQFAIEKLIAKRTSIIIAHRLSTIRHANNILVLSKGEIQEFGSHEALLEIENGHYRDLYEMQFFQTAAE